MKISTKNATFVVPFKLAKNTGQIGFELKFVLKMNILKKSLCVFVHYSKSSFIPIYVNIYVSELSNYFDEIILVTNHRPINSGNIFNHQNVSTLFVENEGYDFGMFYKALKTINPLEYNQIACINDSNIIFNELKSIFTWGRSQQTDFWGLIDSYQSPHFSTHKSNFHIQSHFIVFNHKAIDKLSAFFESLDIQEILNEKDPKKLREIVINSWEIGLSQFLIKEGLSCCSYIDSQYYANLHLSGKRTNIGLKLYPELIRSGFPIIKKKVITKGKWKDIFRTSSNWKNLIRQYGNQDWEIEALIDELIQIKNESGNQPLVKMKRKFSQLIKSLFFGF